jgi:hypothetical protein
MTPRKRKRKNEDLPPNLYVDVKNGAEYFVWENPLTLKRKSIGTDRKDAVKKAVLLNEAMREMGVTSRTTRVVSNTVAELVGKFEAERLALSVLNESRPAIYQSRWRHERVRFDLAASYRRVRGGG